MKRARTIDPLELAHRIFGPDPAVLPGTWVVAAETDDPQTGAVTSRGWAFRATPPAAPSATAPAKPPGAVLPAADAHPGIGGQPHGQRRPQDRTAASTAPSATPPKGSW